MKKLFFVLVLSLVGCEQSKLSDDCSHPGKAFEVRTVLDGKPVICRAVFCRSSNGPALLCEALDGGAR